jgi:O-antigen ligase
MARPVAPGHTATAACVVAYVGWTVANDFLNRPYTAAGLFHPAFLLTGFYVARRWNVEPHKGALRAFFASAAILAVWALYQASSGQGRGHAFFETPNTLATVLNLGLAPVLVLIAYGERRPLALGVAVVLFAGVVATLSRGGLFSLAAALVIVSLFAGTRPRIDGLYRLAAAVTLGGVLALLALEIPRWLGTPAGSPVGGIGDVVSTLTASAGSRSELYSLALSSVAAHPWLGSGYLAFQSLLEAHRAQVPSYGTQDITYFAHNDYLQTLLELGIPGVAAFAAMLLTPFWAAIRARRSACDDVTLLAVLAGIAAMGIHALVDFPFYVPICLLLFGALVGEADRLTARAPSAAPVGPFAASRLLKALAAAAVIAVLGAPAVAEGLAKYGERSWRSGNAQSAAVAFELARKVQPRDWRYHWYAGQFWQAQALSNANREAAERADRAFAAAVSANPVEPRALLGRLATQLRLGTLLKSPQSAATLRRWADDALALAPLNPAVRQDSAAALDALTRRK